LSRIRLREIEVRLQNEFMPADLLINFFDVFSLEGWPTDDEGVEDDTDGPRVNFKAVSVRGVEQYLRSDIVRRAADGLLPLARALDKGGQTEVADFDVHVRVKEKIAELQVAVDDLVSVHVMAGTNKLNHKKSGLWFCEDATTVEHVHEGAVGTKLKGHVDVLFILETIYESNDVGMV
jgi:hypothetical protein